MKPEDIHWLDEEEAEPTEDTSVEPEDGEEPSSPEPPDEARPKRQRLRPALLLVSAVIVIALVLALAYLIYRNLSGGSEAKTLHLTENTVDYTTDSVSKVRPFAGLAVHLGVDGAQAYDTKGTQIWNLPYTMASPTLETTDVYAVIADLGGSQMLLVDSTGLVRTITTEAPILYCTVSREGYTAAILNAESHHTLAVYDPEGNVLVRRITYSDQDGIPMCIAINDDATCMATAYVIYSEAELRSAVTLFNLTDTASDSIDRIAGNYTYSDTLIADLHYMNDMLIAVGDNRLIGLRASGNTAEEWTEDLSYQITAVGFGEDYLALTLGSGLIGVAGTAPSNLIVVASDGNHRYETSLTDPRDLKVSNNTIVYQDSFDYYAIDSFGNTVWYYNAENAMQLYALSDQFALGNTGSSLQFYSIVAAGDTKGE